MCSLIVILNQNILPPILPGERGKGWSLPYAGDLYVSKKYYQISARIGKPKHQLS